MNVKWHYFRHGWNRIKKKIPTIGRAAKTIALIFSIVGIFGLASSYWLSWSGIIPLLASVGGMVVFFGLWIEKEADDEEKKEHFSNFTDVRRNIKLKSEIGWWILMLGIVIELTTAAGLTILEEYKEWKNNPWNGNILNISANVYFEVKGTNAPIVSEGYNKGVMILCGSAPKFMPTGEIKGGIGMVPLYSFNLNSGYPVETLKTNSPNDSPSWKSLKRAYSLEFHTEGTEAASVGLGGGFDPVKNIKYAKCLYIRLYVLPKNTEILTGTVVVVVEGTTGNIHESFQILPQTAAFDDAGSSIIATNIVPAK